MTGISPGGRRAMWAVGQAPLASSLVIFAVMHSIKRAVVFPRYIPEVAGVSPSLVDEPVSRANFIKHHPWQCLCV